MFPNILEAADSTRGAYTNVGSVDKKYRMDEASIERAKERSEPSYTYAPATLAWLIETLDQRYELRDNGTIVRFLRENPFLFRLLLGAHEKIREHFGPDVRAVLEVVKDPEVEDDERLFVFVRTEMSPNEALTRLRVLDEGWWLDVLPETQGKMSIDVEYV